VYSGSSAGGTSLPSSNASACSASDHHRERVARARHARGDAQLDHAHEIPDRRFTRRPRAWRSPRASSASEEQPSIPTLRGAQRPRGSSAPRAGTRPAACAAGSPVVETGHLARLALASASELLPTVSSVTSAERRRRHTGRRVRAPGPSADSDPTRARPLTLSTAVPSDRHRRMPCWISWLSSATELGLRPVVRAAAPPAPARRAVRERSSTTSSPGPCDTVNTRRRQAHRPPRSCRSRAPSRRSGRPPAPRPASRSRHHQAAGPAPSRPLQALHPTGSPPKRSLTSHRIFYPDRTREERARTPHRCQAKGAGPRAIPGRTTAQPNRPR
jgi:hypothetical protein